MNIESETAVPVPAELTKHQDLITEIRSELAFFAERVMFEPNDGATRNRIENTVKVYFSYLFKRGKIHDYVVRCDVLNNTPEDIKRGRLNCDVAFRPSEYAEFVYMPMTVGPADVAMN